MHPFPAVYIGWHEQRIPHRDTDCRRCIDWNTVAAETAACRAGRRWDQSDRAEKGTTMFCNNSCNNGIWLIILIIILFGWGGNGMGCGCNNCGCDNNCGCNNGCC